MRIGFIGLGKLGLPVALAVEQKGHTVYGCDLNPAISEFLERWLGQHWLITAKLKSSTASI